MCHWQNKQEVLLGLEEFITSAVFSEQTSPLQWLPRDIKQKEEDSPNEQKAKQDNWAFNRSLRNRSEVA